MEAVFIFIIFIIIGICGMFFTEKQDAFFDGIQSASEEMKLWNQREENQKNCYRQ